MNSYSSLDEATRRYQEEIAARQQAWYNAQFRSPFGQADEVLAAQLRRAQQHRPAPPPPRSKFDTPDVIDMVEGADGVFRVPAQLEYRARER